MQALLQKHLKEDERALDKGGLFYPRPPKLKIGAPYYLNVTITDTGKNPHGIFTAEQLSKAADVVIYPGDVPTGGIVGLSHEPAYRSRSAVDPAGYERIPGPRLTPWLHGHHRRTRLLGDQVRRCAGSRHAMAAR